MSLPLNIIDVFIEMGFEFSFIADFCGITKKELRERCSQEGLLSFDERLGSLYSSIGEVEWIKYEIDERLNISSIYRLLILRKIQKAGLPEKCPIKNNKLSYERLSKKICCDSAVVVCRERPHTREIDVYVVSFAAYIEGKKPHVTLKDSIRYENTVVSSDGSIYTRSGKKRKTILDNKYARSSFMTRQGKWQTQYYHQIVAECFLRKANNKFEIDHKNRNKSDNRVENLRFVSKPFNIKNQDFENKSMRPCVTVNIETGKSITHRSACAAAKSIGSSPSAVKKVLDNHMHKTQGHKIYQVQ
jgi:hypothetical protein